jgi:uncharacterized protein YndB with AHSA1/START domain
MEAKHKTVITVETIVNASPPRVWKAWTTPEDIMKWNNASPDWHTPKASHDLKPGGTFVFRMEAKDGSFGFDFSGVYDIVAPDKYLEYTLGDGRKVRIRFENNGDKTHVTEIFDAESVHSIEQQKTGWQAILDNFKKYVEETPE